jgi:hypothetical protein
MTQTWLGKFRRADCTEDTGTPGHEDTEDTEDTEEKS